MLLAGCATQTASVLQATDSKRPRNVELTATPFHAQERYQCGPASLAMVLQAAGSKVTPEELVPQVYVPQRQGSLPPEMLVAARRNGAFAMILPPTLDALLTEVAAGHPVVVLQNLSLPVSPLWHYAVVIGYDLDRREIILRSGTTEREIMPLSTFEHTWKRSDFWAMVALPPGRLPATTEEGDTVSALVAFEKTAGPERARKAYEAGIGRWPHNLTLLMGSGNTAYAMGDREGAAQAFHAATLAHPDSTPAFNNLASVLAELGRLDEAQAAAEKAVALGGPWREAATATLAAIHAQRRVAR